MARPPSPTLTQAELRLMQILWNQGKATVAEVAAELKSGSGLAYTTVLTTMQVLEKKGYLRHHKEGRAFVYEPIVNRDEASRKAIKHVARHFFQDSHELLVLNILKNEKVSATELKRLKKLVAES